MKASTAVQGVGQSGTAPAQPIATPWYSAAFTAACQDVALPLGKLPSTARPIKGNLPSVCGKIAGMAKVPKPHHWVFWDVDPRSLDTAKSRDYILPRILEFGGIAEVRWAIATYGMDGIHRFLRDVGHPELSKRTLGFWRAALKSEDEPWASPPGWRQSSAALWID